MPMTKYNMDAQSGGGGSNKDIYLGIAGGVVSGMELSYLNDAKQVLKYGQRIEGKVGSAEIRCSTCPRTHRPYRNMSNRQKMFTF